MADMTPGEIAAYRHNLFTSMGFISDGHGNYYPPPEPEPVYEPPVPSYTPPSSYDPFVTGGAGLMQAPAPSYVPPPIPAAPSYVTPPPAAAPEPIKTPAEVEAYREQILSSQGLVGNGSGNYYTPDYYAAQPAAQAAQNLNTSETAASGLFSGVQGSGLNQTPLDVPPQQLTTTDLGSGSFQTPTQEVSTMVDTTPVDVEEYRNALFTSMGWVSDGNGNYYEPAPVYSAPASIEIPSYDPFVTGGASITPEYQAPAFQPYNISTPVQEPVAQPVAEKTPAEVATYRDAILSSQGLVNNGTGSYYTPDYYAAQPVAEAAHDANTAATAASDLFAGVQGTGNNPTQIDTASQPMTTVTLGSGSFQTPSQGASTMADMTPAEVAAYRDEVLTSQGLTNDGTGNYYDQAYYAAQPAAQAAQNLNTAATTASGLFGGVQNSVAQDAVRASAGQAPGTSMPTPTPEPQTQQQQQQGKTPQQLETIKGTWNQFLWGMKTPSEIMQAMSQYNVTFEDIEKATGYPKAVAQALLEQASKPKSTNPASQRVDPTTPYNPSRVGTQGPTPTTGMTNIQTGGDQDKAMKDYYAAYFGGAQPDSGLLSNWYSKSYNPAPTGFSNANKGASAASGMANSLKWGTPELDAKSTPTLYKYMTNYGMTAKNVADALGFTEDAVVNHFKTYGIDVTKLPGASGSSSTTTPVNTYPQDVGGQ